MPAKLGFLSLRGGQKGRRSNLAAEGDPLCSTGLARRFAPRDDRNESSNFPQVFDTPGLCYPYRMKLEPSTKKTLLQIAVLSGLSMLTTSKNIFTSGSPSALSTYLMTADRFWHGQAIYAAPDWGGANYFKYSPLFVFLFLPIYALNPFWRCLLWGVLNIVVFWAGVSVWFRLEKKTSGWMFFAFLLMSMELDGPIRHLQANALLVGLILLGLAAYRDQKYVWAAGLLFLPASFKVFPGLVLAALLPHRKFKFLAALTAVAITAFLLPAMVVGFSKNIEIHRGWLQMLRLNASPGGFADTYGDPSQRLLYLANAFGFYGLRPLGDLVAKGVFVIGIGTLGWAAAKHPRIPWGWWIPLALSTMLLVSPGTEAATFVVVAPAFAFLTYAALAESPRRARLFFAVLAMVLVTLAYNDVWPRFLWNPRDHRSVSKTIGTFLIFWLSLSWAFRPARDAKAMFV
jgi:hypothetical protein